MIIRFMNKNSDSLGYTDGLTICPRVDERIIRHIYSSDNKVIGVNYIKVLQVTHDVRFNVIKITLDTTDQFDLFKG